jgi:hypothetical protein
MGLSESLAPGSRVRVRGEEWAVERCLSMATGGYAVHVQGLSTTWCRRGARWGSRSRMGRAA